MLEQITVSYGIPLAYLGLGIAALCAVVFPVIQMIQDFKKARQALIGVGLVALLFVITYLLAHKQDFSVGDIYVAAEKMKFIEASIFMVYTLLFGSVLAIVVSAVSGYFK